MGSWVMSGLGPEQRGAGTLTGCERIGHRLPATRRVRVTADRVALIDWDEAHVDVPDLDLVLPFNAAQLEGERRDSAEQAQAAWEAAICWKDEYSVRKLAQVRAV